MAETFDYINVNKEKFIDDLKRLCRQPSISASKKGIEECAELVKRMMEEVGIDARIIPIKNGSPVVFGEMRSKKSSRTLAFYNHYDVQPPEPYEEWVSPPFEPHIKEGKIYCRGVSDNKGDIVARLKATEALIKTVGEIPVNLKFIVEGEEEISSPHLGAFAREHPELLKADGYLWEGGDVDGKNRPEVELGVKGMLYVELTVKGANVDEHSKRAPLIPDPSWRLTWALASIKDPDETIKISGFYDNVKEPTEKEIMLLQEMPFEEEMMKKKWGLKEFLGGLTGLEALKNLYLKPACTICGFGSGYQGPGSKTVLPSTAMAKVSFRLVPNQDPDDILRKLKAHLEKKGFGDVQIEKLGGYEASRVSVENAFAKLVVSTLEETYGVKPVVHPTGIGSGPMYIAQNWMGIPSVMAGGVRYIDSYQHAPNENIRIEDFMLSIRFVSMLIRRFG